MNKINNIIRWSYFSNFLFIFREVKEECGLDVIDLHKIGLVQVEFEGDPTLLDVYVFETCKYQGKIIETEGKLSIVEFILVHLFKIFL